jgi:CAS/CSE protein, C-terminus
MKEASTNVLKIINAYFFHHPVQICDSIQPNLFGMVVERLFLLELQKVSGVTEKKICSVGLAK